MADFEEEEALEHTLLIVREVNVYKIPTRHTSGGYKCAEWLVSDKIWSGRLRVVSKKEVCELRLEDNSTGELFAACQVWPGKREASVETVVDSSRYFVLRIEDGRGKHAFIGMGFNERNEAFDFNVALSDHEKHFLNEAGRAKESGHGLGEGGSMGSSSEGRDGYGESLSLGSKIVPLNLSLKEGETIRINMKKPQSSSAGSGKKLTIAPPSSAGGLQVKAPSSSATPFLAPPPGTTPRPTQKIAPLTNSNTHPFSGGIAQSGLVTQAPKADEKDPFADFSQFQSTLPNTKKTEASTPAAGWAAF